MDDLKALYFRIENPIDNKSKWSKILNIYSMSIDYKNFYETFFPKKETKVYYIEEDKNIFYLAMWSIWKSKMLSYSEDELAELINNKTFESNIYEVVKELRDLESIKTIERLKEVLSKKDINKYFSYLFSEYEHELTITSNFGLKIDSTNNVILTITVEAANLYKLLKLFVNECINYELEYFIKFNESGKDIILDFYTSLDNLRETEKILSILKKEYYSFFKNNYHNILSGNINEWIGIKNKDYFSLTEYVANRTKILYRSIDSVLYEYINNHLNILVSYKDGRMNLVEYLSTYIMEKVVTKLLSTNIRTNSEYFFIANSEDLINLKKYIKDRLSSNMKEILKERIYMKESDDKITLKLNANKSIDIEVNVFMSAIRNLIHPLMLKDNSLEKSFRVRIKNECQFYKIDPDKFCLDFAFAKKIFFDNRKYTTYQNEIDKIHQEIEKLDNLEKLISSEITEETREKISTSMNELLSIYED